ncbi:hypothetical protein QAD02_016680 [Eretmocerus hayati]|uniref:Uncharacterized protein n=1 Tax=Eretmocerus hayati TaxID=131215 RepID=A0ACC2PCT8_9HYME|nr:hypothetical protein QAD02_016680 [Eretmocerus hayati]
MKRKLDDILPITDEENEIAEVSPSLPNNHTTVNVGTEESVFTWPFVISNYSKLPSDTGKLIVSPTFGIGYYEFVLLVYPGGDQKSSKGYVSIFLRFLSNTKASITFQLSIIDQDGIKKSSNSRSTNTYDLISQPQKHTFGESRFVESSWLLSNVLQSTNDRLIVLCEIFNVNASDSLYEVEKLRTYGKFLNNEQFSDVKIIVDNKTIYAHKIVLATGNEVFSTMIKGDSKVDGNDVINIEDTEYEVVVELIRFIYTGQVHNIEKMAKKLIIAADRYGVIQLKYKCEKYLCPFLSPDNVLDYLKLADTYGLDELKSRAISFFVTYRKIVMKLDNFRDEMKQLHPDLTADLMTGFSSI